jgi:hypothetical protein
MDVSPYNLMNCNGEFKFIDLGFAQLYLYANMPRNLFGVKSYRSPWAHIASNLQIAEHLELHLANSNPLYFVCGLKSSSHNKIKALNFFGF